MIYLIIALVWLIGFIATFIWGGKKGFPMFDRVWYSVFWVVIIPLYVVYWLHMKM